MAAKGLSIVCNGIEDVASREIREILGVNSVEKKGHVVFNAKREEDLCVLGYLSQSSERVLKLINEFEFESEPFEGIRNVLSKAKLPKGAFKVLSIRTGSHSFNSEAIMECAVSSLKENSIECSFKNYDNILVIFVSANSCCMGIDVSHLDLHKREYRIFTSPSDIRATVAYSMVRMSGFKEGEVLLDPFCNSGTIAIEAALSATKKSPRFYEKAKIKCSAGLEELDSMIKETKSKIIAVDANNSNVVSTKKNAKIAGVLKNITFSRSDMEWMDIKFEKKGIDRIVSKLPEIRKDGNVERMKGIFNEFFYNAEYILSDKGTIVIMSESIEHLKPLIARYSLKITGEREVEVGKDRRHIYTISKSSS